MSFFVAASALILMAAVALLALTRLGRRTRSTALIALLWAAALGLSLSGWVPDGLPEYLVRSAAVLLAGALLGWLIGRTMPNLETLVVTTAVAAAVDLLSFSQGATRALLAGGSPALPYLLLGVPWQGGSRAVVGVGDLAFLAASFHLLPSPGGSPLQLALPVLGLELALIVGLQTGGAAGIPFLAAALAAAWWLGRRESRGDGTSKSRSWRCRRSG